MSFWFSKYAAVRMLGKQVTGNIESDEFFCMKKPDGSPIYIRGKVITSKDPGWVEFGLNTQHLIAGSYLEFCDKDRVGKSDIFGAEDSRLFSRYSRTSHCLCQARDAGATRFVRSSSKMSPHAASALKQTTFVWIATCFLSMVARKGSRKGASRTFSLSKQPKISDILSLVSLKKLAESATTSGSNKHYINYINNQNISTLMR